jgi:hypothetical protein
MEFNVDKCNKRGIAINNPALITHLFYIIYSNVT